MKDFEAYGKYRQEGYTVLGRISDAEEHQVEDARTRKREILSSPRKERAKHKQRVGKGRTVILTVMITLLAFSATLIGADLLSDRSALAAYVSLFKKEKEQASMTFYFVYATHSEDKAISYKNASVIREEGGAGYVMKSGDEYYVILNAYDDRDDAEKVASRQLTYGVYEVAAPPLPTNKNTAFALMESSIPLCHSAYTTLYEAANDLASGSYTTVDFRRTIQRKKEEISATEERYVESIRGKEDTVTIEYKVLLAEIRSAFENLSESSDHIVADARYYSVMILHSYAAFANKYFS